MLSSAYASKLDHAHMITYPDLGTKRSRQFCEVFKDIVILRNAGNADSGARLLHMQIDRIQADLADSSVLHRKPGHYGAPDVFLHNVAGRTVVIAHTDVCTDGRGVWHIRIFVGIRRLYPDRIGLKDKIAETVEDRFVLIYLDAAQLMWAVSNDRIFWTT